MTFVPIFEKDGNRLFVLKKDFVAETEDEAMQIGWGALLVESILLEMPFRGEVIEIDLENVPHIKARVGYEPVAVISGPMFEEAKE